MVNSASLLEFLFSPEQMFFFLAENKKTFFYVIIHSCVLEAQKKKNLISYLLDFTQLVEFESDQIEELKANQVKVDCCHPKITPILRFYSSSHNHYFINIYIAVGRAA